MNGAVAACSQTYRHTASSLLFPECNGSDLGAGQTVKMTVCADRRLMHLNGRRCLPRQPFSWEFTGMSTRLILKLLNVTHELEQRINAAALKDTLISVYQLEPSH